MIAQRFSIGLMSGEQAGQSSITVVLRYAIVEEAVLMHAPSCM
jgi:hypothetical protein